VHEQYEIDLKKTAPND